MNRYKLTLDDRRASGGPWVALVHRGASCVGVGADRYSLASAVRYALKETRYRRRAGQFRVEYIGSLLA